MTSSTTKRPLFTADITLRLALIAGVVVLLLAILAAPRKDFHGIYICGLCGAEQTVGRSTIAGHIYRERLSIRATAMSRALDPGARPKCLHEWYLFRWGTSYYSGLWSGDQGDGRSGNYFSTYMLTHDDAFSGQLAAMPRARQVWRAIVRAEASARGGEDLLGEWWFDQASPRAFAEWWAANGKALRRRGATAQPQK